MRKKTDRFTHRGQALIVVAFAAIGLFAIVGLAIDGSAKFSDRRHAQNAADTAALAGALSKINGDPLWDYVAVQRAYENGYDNDLVTNTVEIHSPPISGLYSNCYDVHFTCTNYVQVIINSYVNTFFARVIGVNQMHNRVDAIAATVTQVDSFRFGGNAIVALSPTGCGIVAGGTTNATINGGGLFSNSDDSTCSFKKQSCAGLLDVNNVDGTQGLVHTVGGYSLNTGCMPNADMSPGEKQIAFPPLYQEIPEPPECGIPGTKPVGNPTAVTLSPGYYDAIPPKPNITNVTLEPGVYCIGTTLKANSGDTLTVLGTYTPSPSNPSPTYPGVFLYFKSGGYFTFNGSATVRLWGFNSVNDPSLSSKYLGFLMYVSPDYTTLTPPNCTINGNSGDAFWGTIYAPYCNLKLNGTSDSNSFQSQLIGYTVDLTGASGVTLNYDAGSSAVWTIPQQVGLAN